MPCYCIYNIRTGRMISCSVRDKDTAEYLKGEGVVFCEVGVPDPENEERTINVLELEGYGAKEFDEDEILDELAKPENQRFPNEKMQCFQEFFEPTRDINVADKIRRNFIINKSKGECLECLSGELTQADLEDEPQLYEKEIRRRNHV